MSILLFLAFLNVSPASEPECFADMFCIDSEQRGDTVDVFVVNLLPWEFTMSMDMVLENLHSLRQLPFVESFPGAQSSEAVSLVIDRHNSSWSYRFDLKYMLGTLDAEHDDDYAYGLPFSKGSSYLVGQAFGGATTHRGKYAIDWDMPSGTGVRTARNGTVVEVNESYIEGRLDPSLKTRANYVKVRHRDGTIGHYAHLRHNGVNVSVGDSVERGDLLGDSGNTGYSSGPHLHFEVYTVTEDLTRQTIPIRFETGGRRVVRLTEGRIYGH